MDSASIVTTSTNLAMNTTGGNVKRSMTDSDAEPPGKHIRMDEDDDIPSRKCGKVDRRRSEGIIYHFF